MLSFHNLCFNFLNILIQFVSLKLMGIKKGTEHKRTPLIFLPLFTLKFSGIYFCKLYEKLLLQYFVISVECIHKEMLFISHFFL
jgi:hypothetical protein